MFTVDGVQVVVKQHIILNPGIDVPSPFSTRRSGQPTLLPRPKEKTREGERDLWLTALRLRRTMAAPRITTNSLPFRNTLLNPARLRSYVLRLPLFTRLIIVAILFFWLLELQTVWSVVQWGSLDPSKVSFGSMYRLNTFALIHTGFLHMLMDTLCLVPLLDRFEAEWGTLSSLALFMGRRSP